MAGFGFGFGGFATGLTNGMQAGIGIRRAQQERQLNQMKLLQLQRQQEVDQEGQQAADATRQAIASGQVQLKDAGTYFATHFAPKLALSYMALGKPELAKGILAWSDQAENKEIINKMATLAGAINWAKTSGNLAPAKEAMRSLYNGLPAQLTGGAKFQDLTISKGPNGKVNGYSAIFSGPDGKRFKKSWPDLNSMIQETEGYLHPSAYMERLHSAGLLNALGPSAPSAQPQSAAPAAQATPAPNAALLSPQPTETVPAQLSGGTTTDIPAAVPAGSPVADATTITAPQSVAAIAPALVGGVPQGTSAVPPVAPRLPVNAPPAPPVQVASAAQELPSPSAPDQTTLPSPPMPPATSGGTQSVAPQLPMPQATSSPDAQVDVVPTRPAELPAAAAPASPAYQQAAQQVVGHSMFDAIPAEIKDYARLLLQSGDPAQIKAGQALLTKAMEQYGTPKVVAPGATVEAFGRKMYQNKTGIFDNTTLTALADQYLAGDRTVMQNLGRSSIGALNVTALREKIVARAKEIGMSPQQIAAQLGQFNSYMAAQKATGTRSGNIEMAIAEAQQMAPQVVETSAKVNRTEYPIINKRILQFKEGTGDPNVVAFSAALNSLINIYARVVNPSGSTTVSDKEHAREILSQAWSKGQIESGVRQLMKEMELAGKSPGIASQRIRQQFLHSTKGGTDSATSDQPSNDPLGLR